ncbi:MAG: glycosyltransferase family 4 protein [Anaerolineae bacterium]|nr:glycosyltransferase family 4 protein [Anaerolineae bacterium]
MRIGLVNEYFPPHAPGGAEWSAYYLGRGLVEAGHRVVVITPNYGAPHNEVREGMAIRRFWYPQKLEPGDLARSSLHGNVLFYLYSGSQVYRIAREEGLEVLHVQNVYSLPGTLLASRWLRVPTIVTLRDLRSVCVGCLCLHRDEYVPEHCSVLQHWHCMKEFDSRYNVGKGIWHRAKWYSQAVAKRLDLTVRNWFLRRADRVITISDGLKAIYVRAGRFSSERAQTIYNLPPIISSVEVNAAQLRCQYGFQGRKIVLAVGKMSFGKGSDVLLSAASGILRAVPNALIVFIGRKNPLIEVPKDLQPHVRMLGVLPHQQVLKLYCVADVVAMPSVWPEPHGRVLLEAMSLGRPVVGTKVGGIPETVEDGVSGLLVARSDPDMLAAAITRILLDAELGERLGKCGRQVVESRFRAEDIVQRTLALYREALTERE